MSARLTFSRGSRPRDSTWISRIGSRVRSPSPHSPCSTPSDVARRIRWALLSERCSSKNSPRSPLRWARSGCHVRPPVPEVTRCPEAEGNEESVHPESRLEFGHEVLARLGAPQLGQDEHVGVQTHDVIENVRRSTPTVDTGVKVKRRDTHVQNPRWSLRALWQALLGGICQRGLRSPTLVGRRVHR